MKTTSEDVAQLPNLELTAERQGLVNLMCAPFRQDPGYQTTKANFTVFVKRMGNRNVLDCLVAIKGYCPI